MIAYATTTRTRRNVSALRAAGWRLLLTPDIHTLHDGFAYALDNGAWGAYQRGDAWPEEKFVELVERYGASADWVVAPDIVMGGAESLRRSVEWLPRLVGVTRVLLAVQDGMQPADVGHLLDDQVGIFVGGSTEWKMATMRQWGDACVEAGAWCHVGRVNSVRRIRLCHSARVTSFDGTSATRFAVNINNLTAASRLQALPGVFDG